MLPARPAGPPDLDDDLALERLAVQTVGRLRRPQV
jgi:hypothetical protein